MTPDEQRQHEARARLTYLAEPADKVLGALLRENEPAAVLAAVLAGRLPSRVKRPDRDAGVVTRALRRWAARVPANPADPDLAAWQRRGVRLICPDDPEWPTQLEVLGDAAPYALWLRGSADLRFGCLSSVSLVGSRAATAYGSHVATEMAAALGERNWTVVSGGAYGIDGAAHRGALAAEGLTIAILASGVDRPYPAGHAELFDGIAAHGVLVSEWPPGRTPTRHGFLVRNRVIAALTRGTVVVEAGVRSGALSTARHARDLCRPLMAVPGPVTSSVSAGCHEIIRSWGAVCVTGAADVLECAGPVGEHLAERARGPILPHDALDAQTALVLDAVPSRGGSGAAAVAASAGVDLDTVIRCLGSLAAGGFVERCETGWRIRRTPR
ncbi:MAG TPA: DNA-processing protein DprA [Streptosporangiaceae bacterium]|jgi:DNA processing protein|nr:DNA-processing protein DprA [Streptosporangiaceae bacterium]